MLLTHNQRLRTEERAPTDNTATKSVSIMSVTAAMTNLDPDAIFSDTTEETSILLSTIPSYKPVEETTPVPYPLPSDSPISEPSNLLETSPYEVPIEEPTSVLHYEPNNLSPIG